MDFITIGSRILGLLSHVWVWFWLLHATGIFYQIKVEWYSIPFYLSMLICIIAHLYIVVTKD